MQNDSFDSPLRLSLGGNLYPLVKPFTNISPEDQEALNQVQSSLKANNSAANFLNLINLNQDDLIQLGVKSEQASPENLARYMRYQESLGHAALESDMQARYKDLTEGDKPASHAQAITLIHQEFSEFLQAYDNSQLAARLEAIGKKPESKGSADAATESPTYSGLTKLSVSQAMKDFSLNLGSVNLTNILNEQRIKNFIDSYSYRLHDDSFMLALPKESLEQERQYIHLNAEEYKHFSKVMANSFAEDINLLDTTNISRDDNLIIYPSVPALLDNAGGLLSISPTENAPKLLLPKRRELNFAGITFVKQGTLILPKVLTEAESPLVNTQEPETLLSRSSINLARNAFKIYTLALEAENPTLNDFTPSSNIAHNLNLGDFAKDALLELNAKQSQEKEEKTLIADTFKSLQNASPEDVNARFVTYENQQGTLPDLYKNLAYNNLFLKSLEMNQINPVQAAEYLTRTIDQTLSGREVVEKTTILQRIEKIFKVFEAVYLEIFSNAETISGAALGEGKIKPLMENQGIQEYFRKNQTAGTLTI